MTGRPQPAQPRDGLFDANHHYVPQFILRNFATQKGKVHQFYVYDKQAGRSFPTNVKNILSERDFNVFSAGQYRVSFEGQLQHIETATSTIVSKIVDNRNISCLTDEDKSWLCIFTSAQMLRVRQFREEMKDMDEQLYALIRESGGDPNDVANYRPFQNDDEIRRFSCEFMMESSVDFAKHLAILHMVLMSTKSSDPFYISDCPVTKYHDRINDLYGNLGLACEGIQVHIPVSDTMMIAFICPTTVNEIKEGFERIKNHYDQLAALRVLGNAESQAFAVQQIEALKGPLENLEKLKKAIEQGIPAECTKDNTLFYNSLQVRCAERYVLSKRKNFDLVEDMVRRDRTLRDGGSRMQVR